MGNLDLDLDNLSEDELDEVLNTLVRGISKRIKEEENKPRVIVPQRIKQMAHVYGLLKPIAEESNAKISYAMYTPFNSMGYITITGTNVLANNPALFLHAARLASNFEVVSKLNGTVDVNFTFHGLTKPVEID